jgi:hypothetical protein
VEHQGDDDNSTHRDSAFLQTDIENLIAEATHKTSEAEELLFQPQAGLTHNAGQQPSTVNPVISKNEKEIKAECEQEIDTKSNQHS